MRWRHRLWLSVTPILLALSLFLLVIYLHKRGVLSSAWLQRNGDALAAVGSALNIVVFAVAGTLGYYRFFKGRTWVKRADLSVVVNVIEGPDGQFLHSISLSVSNKGTVAIWQPQPMACATLRHRDGSLSTIDIDNWTKPPGYSATETHTLEVVDVGETASLFTEHLVEKDVWAVSYAVSVRSAGGDLWNTACAVANKA